MTTGFGSARRRPANRSGACVGGDVRVGLVAVVVALGTSAGIAQASFADFDRLPGAPPFMGGMFPAGAIYVQVVDVNEDGHQDLASGGLSYWFNNRRGKFIGPVTASSYGSQVNFQIAIGDVNGDGHVDILAPRTFLDALPDSLYLGDGRGTFVDVASTHLPAKLQTSVCAALGDIDGDGDLDAVLGCIWPRVVIPPDTSRNVVYVNDGTYFPHNGTAIPG